MARVTVEDCIDKVENRFELVLLAGHRARQISQGAPITVDRDNDKNPVVALREIADETLSPADLKEDLIHSLQKHVEVDEPEADAADLIDRQATAPEAAGVEEATAVGLRAPQRGVLHEVVAQVVAEELALRADTAVARRGDLQPQPVTAGPACPAR